MENLKRKEINTDTIETFLNGHDPQERIVNLEYNYRDDFVKVYYRNEQDMKCMSMQPFYPFVWARLSACLALCNGKRNDLKILMRKYKIAVKELSIKDYDGNECEDMRDGYRYMFYATQPMSYTTFLDFFKKAGFPIYQDKNQKIEKKLDRPYLAITPQEQYLISTGKRFFKGYEDYNELLRMIFDLETEGLDPTKDRIKLNGIRLNRPVTVDGVTYQNFERIFRITGTTKEEMDKSELKVIDTMFRIIYTFKPDVITAHNGENFDWEFIIERCKQLGTCIEDVTKPYFKGASVYKNPKETILKLGGEVETFHQTIVPGIVITDSLHAVRRAQAVDSSFLKADLKYSTKYLDLVKNNRVYVPGGLIDKTLIDLEKHYAFNNDNGDWYLFNQKCHTPFKFDGETKRNFIPEFNNVDEGYSLVNGKYIVERYLLDDLWECDKVELALNQSAFNICKNLPLPFQKCCTMGTAGQWKSLMMAWSYENNLAIPYASNTGKFTGGLSRLLQTGYVANVIKLDFNSLYPSIILTWAIEDEKDLSGATLKFLEYFLTSREKYKGVKKAADKLIQKFEAFVNAGQKLNAEDNISYHEALTSFASADKLQSIRKVFCNSFFGAYGSNNGAVYPWKSIKCAERTTCTGRQSLRLMINHFSKLNYQPIVGDSVTYDTPIFVKNEDSIDILPICDIFNNEESIDFGDYQYRDFSSKPYLVLTRNGWKNIEYVYKHKTNKQLRRIETKNGLIDCTEDHSLFNNNKEEVKPSLLKRGDKIELYNKKIDYNINTDLTEKKSWLYGFFMADGSSVYCNRTQKYFSKRKNKIVIHNGKRANWKISNKSLDRLNKAKKILEEEFNIKCSIKNHIKSSNVYNLVVENSNFAKEFSSIFYTSYRYKKVPAIILNSNEAVKKSFLDGFCCGDGQNDTIDECIEFGQKSKVAMAGLYFILKELNYNFRCHNRNDKEFLCFRLRNIHGNLLNENYSDRKEDEVWCNRTTTSKSEYVYDISADGTFINALGMICCHNTDGFNFKLPEESQYRYTDEHPYIGKGLSRETKEGKEYTRYEADVAEFNDLYMSDKHYAPKAVNKMGLGIDEVVTSTINFSRKNYADYFPEKPYPKDVKLVGNTVKSKKMPEYISKFLDTGIRLLLQNKGKEFLEEYYNYINKIYNYQIPLKQIASKGKVKKSIEDYVKDCETVTKAGNKKSRQAWMELALKHNLKVDLGETLYFINTGTKKSHSDVKRVTSYNVTLEDGTVKNIKSKLDKEWKVAEDGKNGTIKKLSFDDWVKKNHKEVTINTEIILCCELLPREIIESDEDFFCEEGKEYNVEKYIEQFNKRITPLLVCFSKDIRDLILITNPKDRQYFTDEQSVLVSGQPNKEGDQDTFEQLMTMEDKEIKFWMEHPEWEIPFLKECDMDWEKIKSDYIERKEREKELGIDKLREVYDEILNNLTLDEIDKFEDDGKLPSALEKILVYDPSTNLFISKEYPDVVIGNMYDILDASEYIMANKSDKVEEAVEFQVTNNI